MLLGLRHAPPHGAVNAQGNRLCQNLVGRVQAIRGHDALR